MHLRERLNIADLRVLFLNRQGFVRIRDLLEALGEAVGALSIGALSILTCSGATVRFRFHT
jgi:hypothetical protein